MTFIYYFSIALFMLVCFILCTTILLQESKSMGLGGASFGGDSSDALFGTSTASVLKKFTAVLASIFLIGCITLSLWTAKLGHKAPKATTELTQEIPDGA